MTTPHLLMHLPAQDYVFFFLLSVSAWGLSALRQLPDPTKLYLLLIFNKLNATLPNGLIFERKNYMICLHFLFVIVLIHI